MARFHELDVTPEGLVQLMADLSETRSLLSERNGVTVRIRLLNAEEPYFRVGMHKEQYRSLLDGLTHSHLLERYQKTSQPSEEGEEEKPFGFAK